MYVVIQGYKLSTWWENSAADSKPHIASRMPRDKCSSASLLGLVVHFGGIGN